MTVVVSQDRYIILIEFAVKHVDFQVAELDSILDMIGIQLGSDECRIIPLPNSNSVFRRPFLLLSFPLDFHCPKCFIDESKERMEENSQKQKLSSIILSRCVLVRSVLEIWGYGTTLDDCVQTTMQFKDSTLGSRIITQHANKEKSWKTTIHTLGTRYTRDEQDKMRNSFHFLPFHGPVKMENPDNEFVLIRETELTEKGSAIYPRHDCHGQIIPENNARPPLAVYFGRVLGTRSHKGRGGLEQYSLTKRKYLGPTSMDAELSFIMSNLAQIQSSSMVLDPFVGTGSILLSCAIRGAYCLGTDIDLRVLRGRSQEENIRSNFHQYGLPAPELVRSDNSMYHRHFTRTTNPLFDAIVTDPPYGIRAGARKTGSRLSEPRPVLEEHRHDHIAQTKPYAVSDVMADLLDMAARTLVMGGRLVYVIPSFTTDFSIENDLPKHECLEVLHSCYQPFTSELGRRIVTMKKVIPYEASRRDQYYSSIWTNGTESAEKCANIRDKILEAAKKKPDYAQKAAIRKGKRKLHLQAKKEAKRKENIQAQEL